MSDHPSDSGHWYHRDGTPCYEIEGKGGKLRPTTLRDARKLHLLPSVTSIIRLAAAPGLVNWQIDQAILASLTLPRVEGETDEQFVARVKKDAAEQALRARERGTEIHAVVQGGLEGGPIADDDYIFFDSANQTLLDNCGEQEWICEKSFATDLYGGKVDLHTAEYLIDIKTSQKPVSDANLWPEHFQQLSAYRFGLFGGNSTVRCGILFVNTDNAESRLIWAKEDLLIRWLRCFNDLLDYFYGSKDL